MENHHKLILGFLVILFLGSFLLFSSKYISKTTGYGVSETSGVALGQCLDYKGFVFYTSSNCAECNEQEELFGDGFRFVNVRDCDAYPELCTGINVPSWRYNDTILQGSYQLGELAAIANCQ